MPPVEGLEPVKGEEEGQPGHARGRPTTSPFSALAFKVMSDPFVGKLTYFRVYSGKLERGRPRAQRRPPAAPSASAAS